MFNPAGRDKAKAELLEKKRIAAKIKEWASALVPIELQNGLQIDVKEVACGDPVMSIYMHNISLTNTLC